MARRGPRSWLVALLGVAVAVAEAEAARLSAAGTYGGVANVTCVTSPADAEVVWKFRGQPLALNDTRYKVDRATFNLDGEAALQQRVTLVISDSGVRDHGNYSCQVEGLPASEREAFLDLTFPTDLLAKTDSPVRAKIGQNVSLYCVFKGFNLTEVKWRKSSNASNLVSFPATSFKSIKINDTVVNGTLKIADINKKDNGTYLCAIAKPGNLVVRSIDVLVLDKPLVSIDFIKVVGARKIYFNWTLNNGNDPIKSYSLQYRKKDKDIWTYYSTPLEVDKLSFVITDLEPSTEYMIKMDAKNSQGSGPSSLSKWVTTLKEDPHFVPVLTLNGFSMSSVTIRWDPPPEDIVEYIHYYEVSAKEINSTAPIKIAIHTADSQNVYMFDSLNPDTTYIFQARACSEWTRSCGELSQSVNGTTLNGIAGPCIITSHDCHHDIISGTNTFSVAWEPPKKPNGQILRYILDLYGNSTFFNENGKVTVDEWGPKTRHIDNDVLRTDFESLPANTNFTIKLSAVTKLRKPGVPVFAYCSTPPSAPPRSFLDNIRWIKVRDKNGRWMFKLYLPRVSERFGAICCYRVFVVKMKIKQRLSDMPSPEHLHVSSYKEVHNGKNSAGAYIAEIFTSTTLQNDIFLGDEMTTGTHSADSMTQCKRCASVLPRKITATSTVPPNLISMSTVGIHNPDPSSIEKDNLQRETSDASISSTPLPDVNSDSSEKPDYLLVGKDDKTIKKKRKFERLNFKPETYPNPDSHRNLHRIPYLEPHREFGNRFYAKQENSNADNIKPVTESDIADMDVVKDDFLRFDDDVIDKSSEGITDQLSKNDLVDADSSFTRLLERHKIVSRHVDYYHENDMLRDDNPTDNHPNRQPIGEGKPIEEIVDIAKMNDAQINLDESSNSIFDGQLDKDANYTAFVELIVFSEQSSKMIPMYSDYLTVLKPGPTVIDIDSNNDMEFITLIVIICCVATLVAIVILLCLLHDWCRRDARQNGVEMHNLQTTLRNLYQGIKGNGGRHQLVPLNPPNMPSISKENLLAAYTERQTDSGYGFQQEFELLPDCFSDRTMDASEAKENQSKNRYPDIKAYDQTRVKLSQIDSVVGSDYINANFVMGYKERKRFICAQGPTDVTVDDFWRMIWEYNLELVVMLTNLEEYSKVKCSKYWPDQLQQDKLFNNINVHHVSEKRYSDYIIRELKISKQNNMTHSNSSNQIIEANGIAKKNGDCNNGIHNNTNTSNEERIVHQYHFLIWKDFVAPEYPHAILKFIKRVNEASSVGRPVLVHCSAGVGRTGTLVALDCLLQQLVAENEVAIFNTICDLRRQRNFLVQSLKQYIFVYRALLEFGQYDDTEIPASRLKVTVDQLRQTAENSDMCAMEEEFEKLKLPSIDPIKPCSAGKSPENAAKNRNELIAPFDHNRVILAPIPTKENSTYINASFIEGYNNAESYIITQDPMVSTIADFWRMVSEQEINTIVMLSELGEGKCPRYWDDDEIQYDHINVTYLLSESCPYYTRREFQVTNTKNQDRIRVTQLQYHGWPTVSGQVPEVTRGLIELLGQCNVSSPPTAPLLIHCSLGTDRSSMFVALSILTIQLRTEKRVDVSAVARKLRSQRMCCIDTFLQYEFLHRAIVNYAELHNLLSDN